MGIWKLNPKKLCFGWLLARRPVGGNKKCKACVCQAQGAPDRGDYASKLCPTPYHFMVGVGHI